MEPHRLDLAYNLAWLVVLDLLKFGLYRGSNCEKPGRPAGSGLKPASTHSAACTTENNFVAGADACGAQVSTLTSSFE